jgi:hypothetical protein
MAPQSNLRSAGNDKLEMDDADLLPDEATEELARSGSVPFKPQIVWLNVYWYALLHAMAIYGFYLGMFEAHWRTIGIG